MPTVQRKGNNRQSRDFKRGGINDLREAGMGFCEISGQVAKILPLLFVLGKVGKRKVDTIAEGAIDDLA